MCFMSMEMWVRVGALIIYYPPIHWPVKSFVIFKGLAYMTDNYIHSYMIG